MPHPKNGYFLTNGAKVPGVTTILSRFKDSSALLIWAWKRGKEFPNENLYDSRDRAGELGSIVHEMVEKTLQFDDPFILVRFLKEDDKQRVMSAFEAFQEWFESNKFMVVEQELSLVSEVHQFGGTFDLVARDYKDRLCMIDFKTSDGIYQDFLVQLGAYRLLWNETHPDMPLTGGSHLCRFAKTHGDFAHHYFPDLSEAEEAFILMRKLYDIDKNLKKRC